MSKIALLPGGFKPPHIGHYDMALKFLKDSKADKLIIFVGPKERDGVTQEMSFKLWKIYTQKISNIEIRRAGVSPVRDVYDFVEQEAPEGSIVYLGMGEKDSKDKRYANISKFAEPRGIKFKELLITPQGGGISGTDMRSYIQSDDKELFKKGLPNHIDKDKAWNIAIGNIEEDLSEETSKSVTINYKAKHIKKGFIKVKDLEETDELFPTVEPDKIITKTKDFKGILISTNDKKLDAFKNKQVIINNIDLEFNIPGKKFSIGPTPGEYVTGQKPAPIEAELIDIKPLEEDLYNPKDKVNDYMRSSEFKAGMPDGPKDDIRPAYKYNRGGTYTHGGMYEADEKGKTLHAYDFDDTIAQVKANIRATITSPKGDYKRVIDIPSDKFPEVSKEMEAKFSMMDFDYDFKEFEKQINDAIINSKVVSKLKSSLSNPQIKTTILTARTIGHPVTKFLKKIGLDAYVVPLGLQVGGERVTGQDKANWIENHIKKGYQTVYFIDDSQENRTAVASLKDKYPDISLTVEDPAAVNEWGTMGDEEKVKHAKNIKRLGKDLKKINKGDKYVEVPNYLDGTLRRKLYNEKMSTSDVDAVEDFADKKLNPVDIDLTSDHFFTRLNDPRNKKGISGAELIGFFKRLAKKKKEFVEFLTKYKEVVATDNRTNINIPFMKLANKAIAKTVMRKKDFHTSSPQLSLEKKEMKNENTFTKDWWKEIINEILITEGGAAGHMAHPFNLSFVNSGKDLKDVIEKAAVSLEKNPGAVKIDGVNASIRLVNIDGKKQFALDRGSKQALDIKGVTKSDLEDRFKTKDGSIHGFIKTGGDVLDMFNEALPSLKNDLIKIGAWEDPNILFNMEYVSGKTNVQKYDNNFIAIHGLNKIEMVNEPSAKTGKMLSKRKSTEISYDKNDLQSLLNNLKQTAKKRGFEVYGTVETEMKKKPNFGSALSKNYTIKSNEGDKTQSLDKWLSELNDIPIESTIGMSGVKRPAVGKQVYMALLQGGNIDELFEDEDDKKKAIEGFTTYLATEKLGDEILKVLDSPMGSVENHEGVVIRDKNIADVPFKITGKFILGGMATGFR